MKLEQPAGELVAELASPQVLEGFDASGQPRLRPARRPITVRHLLTHTAGFTYDMWSALMEQYEAYASMPGIITCQNAALMTLCCAIRASAGNTASTSIGLARSSRRSAARRLDRYLAENICQPLGMHDTAFKISRRCTHAWPRSISGATTARCSRPRWSYPRSRSFIWVVVGSIAPRRTTWHSRK